MNKLEYIQHGISGLLQPFRPISLTEMDEVHLMSRFDKKYVFSLSMLQSFLPELLKDYKVLVIDDLRLFQYENLYFDSADLKSYHDHHNGRSVRYKVRFRKYCDTQKIYFELKLKSNKGLTQKARLESPVIKNEVSEPQMAFIEKELGHEISPLQPQVENHFLRITLVNEKDRERLTIDFLIHFKNGKSERSLDELVIAEVKQEHPCYDSAFKKVMQTHRIFPTSISKYCLGTLLTHPGIKYNRFKQKLIILNKISNGVD